MGQKTQTIQIGQHSYAVTQLPGWRSTEVWYGLVASAGPALARVMGGAMASGTGELGDVDMREVSEGVGQLFTRLPWPEFQRLLKELLATATVDGGSTPVLSQFDVLFQGDTMAVLQLAKFALEVNYGNFTDALVKLAVAGAGALSRPKATPSVSSFQAA
jgi:hypothetical protein